MALGESSTPDWLHSRPSAFDIATAKYPETKPKGDLRLRPCLILDVLQGKTTAAIFCRVTYGTKNLRVTERSGADLIIQNSMDMKEMGIPVATRFSLERKDFVVLPWSETVFGCWKGFDSPVLGSLSEDYVKEYAYLMMKKVAEETSP